MGKNLKGKECGRKERQGLLKAWWLVGVGSVIWILWHHNPHDDVAQHTWESRRKQR